MPKSANNNADSSNNTPIEEAFSQLESSSNNMSDIAYLLAIKNMQTISHDTEMFLRNNHMVYTSTMGAAMKKLLGGDNIADVEVVLDKLNVLLTNNKEYQSDMNNASIKMLKDIQGLHIKE